MKLPQVELLDAESLQTALGLGNQIGGVPVRHPPVRPRAREARLGSDQQPFVRMKGLVDQLLRHMGPVAVGRIDEIDAELGEPRPGGLPGRHGGGTRRGLAVVITS